MENSKKRVTTPPRYLQYMLVLVVILLTLPLQLLADYTVSDDFEDFVASALMLRVGLFNNEKHH